MNNNFLSYYSNYIFNNLDKNNPFPFFISCSFTKIGQTGIEREIDVRCMLSYSDLNFKIFLVLYLFSLISIFFNFMSLFETMILFYCKRARVFTIWRDSSVNYFEIEQGISNLSFSNFLIVSNLQNNLNEENFFNIINVLIENKFEEERKIVWKNWLNICNIHLNKFLNNSVQAFS